MYIFPCKRIRYIKLIATSTHIDCLNNSKCSVRYIFKVTKQGALKVTLHHFLFNTSFVFWSQLFFLYFKQTSKALLDIQLDVYKHVEKLQFSFYLDLLSPEIYNSVGSFLVFPKDCLFTCIFHSL